VCFLLVENYSNSRQAAPWWAVLQFFIGLWPNKLKQY
jgi:hypothetical protein